MSKIIQMSEVASLELCKELYELSGWEDTYWVYAMNQIAELLPRKEVEERGYSWYGPSAYSAGYLLRKLPAVDEHNDHWEMWRSAPLNKHEEEWTVEYSAELGATADTPENCLAQLCIALFKANILKREDL